MTGLSVEQFDELVRPYRFCSEELAAEVNRLRDKLAEARAGLRAVETLIDNSHGVYGLHLNGDPSPWSELRADGAFPWLEEFDSAIGDKTSPDEHRAPAAAEKPA